MLTYVQKLSSGKIRAYYEITLTFLFVSQHKLVGSANPKTFSYYVHVIIFKFAVSNCFHSTVPKLNGNQ